MEGMTTLQLYRNKVSIGDEEICCNRLGAVILFQCRMNTLRLKWRQGFIGGAVDCPLCGAVEETVAYFVTKCMMWRRDGAVWSNPRGSVGGDIALQREDTGEGGEKHHIVGGDVEKEKKRNGPTNAGTCTSVVRAHIGADRKALPPKNIIIILMAMMRRLNLTRSELHYDHRMRRL